MAASPEVARPLIARVMLDSPLPQLDRLFDYAIPDALRTVAAAGVRVKVPLRSSGRSTRGYIVEVLSESDYDGQLTPLDEVVSPLPVLTPAVWALARALADRAAGTASEIVRLAIPPRQVRVEKAYLAARQADPATPGTLSPVPTPEVTGYPAGLLENAVEHGERLAVSAIPRPVDLQGGTILAWAVTAATLAARTVALGRTALIVVPDYRDQELAERALRAILTEDRIITWDARKPGPDRYRGFLGALDDRPVVIVGTRSTVYAPSSALGLILIWDDSDPLHNEPLAPYVNARDAALVRQQQTQCALVFLGHTRSADIERLVEIGFVRSVEPSPRVLPKVVPTVNQESDTSGGYRARIPSAAFRVAQEAIAHGPVLVQVARAGYASVLRCAGCGERASCTACAGPLRTARPHDPPSCAWCGAIAARWQCPHCESTRLRVAVGGSVRTAEELGRAFPGSRVVVSDGSRPLVRVAGSPALVIATRGAEPVAEGGYRAVLLLDGERMLARESLWVAEDSLREWSNAVALAAPGAPCYLVGVGGELANTLVTWRQPAWARTEVHGRRELRFPPAVRVASVTGASATVAAALADLGQHVSGSRDAQFDVLGPVPTEQGLSRALVRFDYALGKPIADHLRAAVIRNATGRRRVRRDGVPTAAPVLRVHMDDREFLE